MRVAVMGLGYVGLVSAACLAELGHTVIGVERDPEKRFLIENGEAPFLEKGLQGLLQRNIGGRLAVSADVTEAVRSTEVSFITVGTPFNGETIDLSQVELVAEEIGRSLEGTNDYHVVVVKSTVIPGTTDSRISDVLSTSSGKQVGVEIGLCMNPEFLREGAAVDDFMNPDRIVLGCIDNRTAAKVRELYKSFESIPVIETNCRTAEMIKYTSNCLLGTLVSFTNEIANLCASVGDIDVKDVTDALHLDRRLSRVSESQERVPAGITHFLEAGCGYGGSCLPKDTKSLLAFGISHGEEMSMLSAAVYINDHQYERMIELLRSRFTDLSKITIAVLGLAFKPDTDDMRESVAIPIVEQLVNKCGDIRLYDPLAMSQARLLFSDEVVRYAPSLESALDGADAVLLLTACPEFLEVPAILGRMGSSPVIVDGRRFFDGSDFEHYEGIGRGMGP